LPQSWSSAAAWAPSGWALCLPKQSFS
jgi:hypothetical protein